MKLAICVPARDTVHVGFAICLANLTASLQKNNIEYHLLVNLGTVIPQQRNTLVDEAIQVDATHILWLDSDMHFPSTTVQQLLAHNLPIVAAAYSTRLKPQRSVAFLDKDDLTNRLTKNTGVHLVFAVGMGCMLVDIEVYKYVQKPWYQYLYNKDTQDLSGEDIYFCKTAGDAGYDIYIDADLSNDIAHYGTKAFLIGETDDHSI
tara:strand:- start:701 stop:1315 length:615 start_codon:yes stop_codon:yes gene_type:complete